MHRLKSRGSRNNQIPMACKSRKMTWPFWDLLSLWHVDYDLKRVKPRLHQRNMLRGNKLLVARNMLLDARNKLLDAGNKQLVTRFNWLICGGLSNILDTRSRLHVATMYAVHTMWL